MVIKEERFAALNFPQSCVLCRIMLPTIFASRGDPPNAWNKLIKRKGISRTQCTQIMHTALAARGSHVMIDRGNELLENRRCFR